MGSGMGHGTMMRPRVDIDISELGLDTSLVVILIAVRLEDFKDGPLGREEFVVEGCNDDMEWENDTMGYRVWTTMRVFSIYPCCEIAMEVLVYR